MACGPRSPPATRTSPGIQVWACRLGVALLLVGLLVPAAHAEPYQGPGHEGTVQFGIGGTLAEIEPLVGEGITHVALGGIPDDVCRIDLDTNETYAGSVLVWSPGNETAHIAAEPGRYSTPFRVASHWLWDLNGECTTELTPQGKIWHEPRGRPFIEMRIVERFVNYQIESGSWTQVEAWVFNNGTLPETINISLEHMRPEWEIRNATGVVDISVDPLEKIRVGFELFIPETEPSGTRLLLLEMEGARSDWADRATLVLEVKSGDAALTRGAQDKDDDAIDPYRSREAPSGSDSSSQQVPNAAVVLVFASVLGLIAVIRRRSR